MKQTSVKRLISITDSYPSKITAFALYNACTQLISSSERYDHLRGNIDENAAKLAADLLTDSHTFFTIKEEMARDAENDSSTEDNTTPPEAS